MAKNPKNQTASEGFIRLPRTLLESESWNSLRTKQQKLFLYILQRAQYTPYLYKHNGQDIQLMPGDFCISLRRLVDDFNDTIKFKDEKIDLSFLQRAVSAFLKVGLTDTRTDTGITIIRVVYPGIYDSNNSTTDTLPDTLSIQLRYSHLKEEGKKDKKKDHPSIPSNEGRLMTDDFSSKIEKMEIYPEVLMTQEELHACIKIKGDVEKVKQAVKFIMESPKRKHPITDWPNTLMKWKIENKSQMRAQNQLLYSEKLCQEFENYEDGRGWKCYLYNDREKDQRGILFEPQNAYHQAFFVSLVDGKLLEKCEHFIQDKRMREKN